MKKEDKIKQLVKKGYSAIASEKCDCCCQCGCDSSKEKISEQIGYSKKEVGEFSEANMGLGCGNPVALSNLKKGETVLDLGSGAGFDSFLAAKRVGKKGKVIGVDMTEEMVEKARANALKYGYRNAEFKLGDIEKLPIKDNSIDVVISNCVINLAPNKDKVFSEAYRVLKKGGRIYVSDIVLLGELTENQKKDGKLLVGCVSGALQRGEYLLKFKNAGFKIKILGEDKNISKSQYSGIALESLKLEGIK